MAENEQNERISGTLSGSLTVPGNIHGNISGNQSLSGSLSAGTVIYKNLPLYEGEYTVTPTTETQVLDTSMHRMGDNVTINPIPPNYGLITWNGSVLTVS